MSNRLKNLQKRFTTLISPNNNYNIINSLESIGAKSENLLKLHEKYKKLKKNPSKNKKDIKIILRKLIDDYREVIELMEIYSNIKNINTLKKSLIKNLKELEEVDEPLYFYNNIPSMNNLQKRFNKLSRFANKIRNSRKKTKRKWFK